MAEPLRLGMVDIDTSHAVEFTKRLNQLNTDPSQFVEGARVVGFCPGKSRMAPNRIAEYTPILKGMGVPLFDRPEDLLGKVDGMLIESLEGELHLESAKPFLTAKIPCFIDKPFSGSLATAKALQSLSLETGTPVFSSSSLRFTPELVKLNRKDTPAGPVVGAFSYGPAPFHEPKQGEPTRNPGLYHYGIHPVEVLYTLMGPGCVTVTCHRTKGADLVTGQWKDGRIGTVRGIREGASGYGCSRFGQKAIESISLPTQFIYRELLKAIVAFFRDRKSPVSLSETVEIMAFIEAANRSADNHGRPETVERV